MTRKRTQKKPVQHENLIDVSFNVKASPKLKRFLTTATEAGKTVLSIGQKLLPIVILLSTIATSCAPKQTEPNPSNPPAIEAAQAASKHN